MAESSDVVRTFIAIPLPDSVKRFLSDIQSEFKSAGWTAAWTNPGIFHLTLKFLGPISRELLIPIQSVMAAFSGAYPAFTLTAGGIGVFPHVKNARIVWVGIQGQTDHLIQLVTDLEIKLCAMGIPAQPRPFFPHITLARIKKPVRVRGMISVIKRFERTSSHAFPANRLVLYKSRLHPQGAVHTPLFQIRLNH
ncbi:MAG: RNA 2',3'-cyclic phosphodiesterase [Desulfotignum sp.]|nr:RNA 2',3'-cyclic phosphodiesterase [Desulfotignum sp.]MCF8088764.1 RNA 2',3'-cyclic phosphodiesterase [Desulfotignum sp.]MCF8136975.1 RNA 2',3'-cyclic phosphodiesterase [Desulfotignum sp.]